MNRLFAILALLVLSSAPLKAQMTRFLGNWDALNERDQVARVMISMEGTAVHVHLWGRCTPHLCDWGEQPGAAFSEDVMADPFDSAVAVLAEFWVPEERSRVVIRAAAEDRIEVEVFTQFTDSSGRNSYRIHALLQRSPDLQAMAGQRVSRGVDAAGGK